MSYQLVVAEKPSVAQSLAAVIGAKKRCDGYLEGNGYRVSWCVGHLAGLADAESYDPKYAKWHYEDLPILPENWQFVVRKDKKKQFDILKKLMNSSDTSAVINACDAGREGEAIFRTVYQLAGCQKPMKRLWIRCNAGPVICDKKVTDHHAIIPTQNIQDLNWDSLPAGERAILELVTLRLLCAVGQPYEYMETTVSLECAGYPFTAKGRAVLNPGWKELDGKYRATLKKAEDAEKESSAKSLPVVSEGQRFEVVVPGIKEGQTSPPKHFTEDSLLAAMETVGAQDMPENAERKGLGTPATRAGIMEKLVSSGFVERKKSKKVTQLLPTDAAASLITVLPEQLQSPLLTAEWEYQLKQVENGQVTPESFMDGITTMVKELVSSYQAIPGADVLFPPDREIIGRCPRCGETVTERKQGFFCDNQDCKFVLWKGSKFFSAKKKQLTKELASELLRNGHARLTGCYSEKTGKTYNAVVILEDDGQKSNYRLDFDSKGGGKA